MEALWAVAERIEVAAEFRLALGQQKLDEEADDSFLIWAKDRFPPKLRVHLAATNIRDVVHKRLLHKRPEHEATLRELFERHRPDLELYAYGCESVTAEEFAEVYPLLPGQIDLILQITSALRTRSARAQGDDQAIRGLLQLLGELFREQGLADAPVGSLVTLDRIYEVQHTALDSDVQDSMARVLAQCTAAEDALLLRVAKAVALLELIQDSIPTDAKLVAQCLCDRVDRGNQVPAVTQALEELVRRNLLAYSEKHGYKVQSSAGEEWERERRDIGVAGESIGEVVQGALQYLLAEPERPRLGGRPFPWAAVFSDGRKADDVTLVDPRDDAAIRVDFRLLPREDAAESAWVRRSAETALQDRLVWLAGDSEDARDKARELQRSRALVKKYKPRRESLNAARKLLLQQEENRAEDLEKLARDAVADAWMAGRLNFRGRSIAPEDHGASFAVAVSAAATRVLPDLYPHFVATQIQPSELMQLLDAELSGPSPKFLAGDLGILELDSGRYAPACSGVVPRRVAEYIDAEGGLGALRDGVAMLKLYDAELTDEAIRAVGQARDVLDYQARQIEELGVSATNVADAASRVRYQLESDRPWQAFSALADDLEQIRAAYTSERRRLLQWQEREAEAARARVKARDGFATLTAEQSHQVLRPFARAVTDTTAEAVAPPLAALKEPFAAALTRAEDQANDALDELLSQGERPLVARVPLDLRNRELQSEADVDALVEEIRARLMEHIRAGARVRLV